MCTPLLPSFARACAHVYGHPPPALPTATRRLDEISIQSGPQGSPPSKAGCTLGYARACGTPPDPAPVLELLLVFP